MINLFKNNYLNLANFMSCVITCPAGTYANRTTDPNN